MYSYQDYKVLAGNRTVFRPLFSRSAELSNQKRNFAAELYQKQKLALALPFLGIILLHTSQSLTYTP